MWYFRECDVCWSWCKTDNPKEEKFFRDCPNGHGPMKLIRSVDPENDKSLMIGKEVPLPKPYHHGEY